MSRFAPLRYPSVQVMSPIRPLPCLLFALMARCNVVYELDTGAPPSRTWVVDASYRDVANRPSTDRGVFDAPLGRRLGESCDDASCAPGLECLRTTCGASYFCVASGTYCSQAFSPVCDCTGTTVLSRCGAYARGIGVAYEGACDGRALDGGAADAAEPIAPDVVGLDAPRAALNRCASRICDDGFLCCAEPSSESYGTCQPQRCATCCQRGM